MTWNVFDPPPQGAFDMREHSQRRGAANRALHHALGHPAGRAWLADAIATMQREPIYRPGMTLDQCAHQQGRLSVLLDMQAELNQPPTPEE
jgi:DNA-binding GntR family transcriptional regulator